MTVTPLDGSEVLREVGGGGLPTVSRDPRATLDVDGATDVLHAHRPASTGARHRFAQGARARRTRPSPGSGVVGGGARPGPHRAELRVDARTIARRGSGRRGCAERPREAPEVVLGVARGRS